MSSASIKRALAPQPIITSGQSSLSPPASSPTSGPSLVAKEWVVAPRPQPGPKPASDTPPPRRKAQNRAAQRAFRERRAQKVSELEEQMEEIEKEHESEVEQLRTEMMESNQRLETRLRDTVDAYENDLRNLENEVAMWKTRCSNLENLFQDERRRREFVDKQLAILKGESPSLAPRANDNIASSEGTMQNLMEAQQAYHTPPETANGCGRCLPGSCCQCVEEVFEVGLGADITSAEQKRPLSPSQYRDESFKRQKQTVAEEVGNELETDFTTFQEPPLRPPNASESDFMLNGPIEPCGFCQDGSTCLCAQLAADQATSTSIPFESTPMIKSEEDLPGTLDSSSTKPAHLSCVNGPGTCDKCRSDPTSTLLCKTLSASQPILIGDSGASNKSSAPCPLGSACCRVSKTLDSLPQSQRSEDVMGNDTISPYQNQAITGPTISCADAFDTLSRHPAFERASKDLGEWLPRLKTIPAHGDRRTDENGERTTDSTTSRGPEAMKGPSHPSTAGRTAFEIEAASVLGVLRIFDRRFGRDGN